MAPASSLSPSERSPLLEPSKGNESTSSISSAGSSASDYSKKPLKYVIGNAQPDEEACISRAESPCPSIDGVPELRKKLKWLIPAVGIGIFLSAADQTIIVSSYGRIGSELNALNSTSWIATAYFLTLTTFQPLYGKFSDIFGRRSALLFAYFIFGTGCVFCGLARDIRELIAARAFAGIGGGGMTTVVSILLSDIIPLRERGKWQGYLNIIFAAGSASGAPAGGLLADSVGWRWAFLAQGPMCAVAFLAVYFILDLPPVSHSHWLTRLLSLDFSGALLLILATTALLFGLDRGSNVSWSSEYAYIPLAASLPLYVAFVFVEKHAPNPFAPPRIIFTRNLTPAYLCNFFAMAGYMATLFYIPLFFQAVDNLSSAAAGIRLIPGILGSVTGSVGGGIIMQRTGKYYTMTIIAFSLLFVGTTIIVACTGLLVNSTLGIIIGLAISGFGGGIGVTTTLIALIASADLADQAIVTACSYLFRSLGCSVGVSAVATVVQQVLRKQLRQKLKGEEAERIVREVRESLDFLKDLTPESRHLVREAYRVAVNRGFMVGATMLFGAVVMSFFIRERRLTR